MSLSPKLHRRTREQALAADPRENVWVEASAGTGKTQVLTDRILRLLLAGVKPGRVLALTFTKAAAAEMVNRLVKTLARWRQLPEGELQAELDAMHVQGEERVVARARRLFAEVQDLPAGLSLQTLHSFAQGLLAGFPLEAGLTPGFAALDDRDTQILRLQALQEAIAGAREAGQQWFLDDLGELALMGGEEGLQKIIGNLLRHRRGFETLRTPDAVQPLVERLLGVAEGARPGDVFRAAFVPGGEVERQARAARELFALWDTPTGLAIVEDLEVWLAEDVAGRLACFPRLRAVLLTQKDEPKKHGDALKKAPGLRVVLDFLADALLQLEQQESAVRCAELNGRALRVGVVLAGRYEGLKRAAGVIDYDDMIVRAAELLGRPGVPDWIKYKLDERFDHVLVDEAQDTNGWQWRIIGQLIEDYFADHERQRTLFVVGDMKQAIYRFQGTNPQVFQKEGQLLGAAARAGGRELRDVPLGRSFRSGPAVLDFVNLFLQVVGPEALGLARPATPHVANRERAGGEVVLWPLVTPPDGEEEDPDATIEAARTEAAQRIAAEIEGWLKPGPARLWLPAHGRFARAGDILVLLRSRTHMMLSLVEELHRRNVAVAGVDRLLLTEPLAVLDLVALMQFATQPEDDLNLANLLVSPFLGWRDHEDIRRLPTGGKSLWQRLRQGKSAKAGEAASFLREVLNLADRSTPYEFLDEILSGPLDGRRQLLARLGSEAEQAIEELLNQALLFEETHAPTLAGFVHWLSGDAFEVKRETGAGEDKVRLMTIHGAKGLEAPVVILADTGTDPEKGHAKNKATDSVLLEGPGGVEFPFLLGKKPLPEVLEKARAADSDAGGEENLRLLYVALTRAADHLFIGGAIGEKDAEKLDPETDRRWHSRLKRVLLELDGVERGESPNFVGEVWRLRRGDWGGRGDDGARLLPEGGRSLTEDVGLTLGLAPAVGALSPPLRPSHMPEAPGEGPATGRQRAAAERGRLMHRLFEKLPEVAAENRLESARSWLLGQGMAAGEANAVAAEVLAVLAAHPALFAAGSLAEAPVAGIVGGQVVTGVVDRLLVQEEAVTIVDFKTGLRVPQGLAEVPVAHIEQMALYAAVLEAVFPGRKIVTSLLYTAGPRLISLGAEQLRAALRRAFGERPLSF